MHKLNYGGKTWWYDKYTVFLLEIGRYHNEYREEKIFSNGDEGDFIAAINAYESFEVSNGYKKRLSMIDKNEIKTKIAHQTTKRNV